MLRFVVFVLLLALGACARADEAQIRRVVEATFQGVKVEGVQDAPLGLYEVRVRTPSGIQVLYTDANANHIILGNIIDTRAERDITKERLRKLNLIKFDALPLDQAVKIQRGNGKRVLAMFSDPHCPYCKQFEQTLQRVNDITIYVFMVPIIRPELADHSKAVWCSADRSKAWLELALNGKAPAAGPECPNPVQKNIELGQKLGVSATPTLIFANGERISGGLQLADLTEQLDKSKR
jgi:thiol:disulfide interchange protein DsbC